VRVRAYEKRNGGNQPYLIKRLVLDLDENHSVMKINLLSHRPLVFAIFLFVHVIAMDVVLS
jgi:hypothetical protein